MENFKAPIAEKKPKLLSIHNHDRVDPYYWLNERENQEVLDYVDAENAYTDKLMSHTTEAQDKLFKEIKSRIKEKDESVPYKIGSFYYYYRYEEGSEYPIHCRKRETLEATEEIILNVNELADGKSYCAATGLKISNNANLLSFSTDFVGRRIYTLRFKDLQTGEMLNDTVDNVTGNVIWANDNKTIFYTKQDETTLRSYQVYKHVLGTSVDKDELIFTEEDETFSVGVSKTKSKAFILIESHATESSEIRFVSADSPNDDFVVFHPREKELEYSFDHYESKFYILTNYKAKNFRLMSCPVKETAKSDWQEIIPHRESVLLEDIEIFSEFLVLEERSAGLTNIRIIRWDNSQEHYLDFGEPAYSAGTGYNPDFNTKWLRYSYNSLTTPSSVIDYHMETKEKVVKKEQEVLGDFNKDNYISERVFVESHDGVQVPLSLVYRKDLKDRPDSLINAPLYLTGYGSYGFSYDPYFSSVRLSLLDRGFVFGIAHIRGGQEMGRKWYDDGKMLNKKNTFEDFIACAGWLIEQGYTAPDKLVINGGSAGGLLVGAVMNMRPEMFKIVVADVPFVDVVTTMLDDSIPLTTGEYEEWGNPNEEKYYHYMLSYSPYDNVERKQYPNVLVTSGLHDSQVQYWEPTKWVAKLRDLKTDSNKLLLKTNTDAGHSGASGRFESLKDVAFEYCFIFDLLEISI
ncbi:S9 family peptidase [Chondrinema litorale]|uniref:S9 family peptidase n=1 Tax=Chondrinema litorale TaxID=2994555 RepID=UPI0025438DC5|nr:S9 family peptidase [Chondrinema litorale]UZR95429.1 S9 family peptidase [Chondrinema litorale]